ncbi:MAG: CvpA family protein [Gemmatimonadota bacterium]
MIAVDWTILALVGVSLLLGALRGFVREVFSLIGWVAGAYLALRFSTMLGERIPLEIEWPVVKTILAGIAIIAACVFAAALVGWIAHRLLVAAKLTAADRSLGAVFGLARGIVIVALAVFIARDTQIARQPFWRDSLLLPQVEAAVRFASRHVPVAGVTPG